MPNAQYDIGLGEIGDGVNQIMSQLQDKAQQQERAKGMKMTIDSVPRKDEIVNAYLDNALRAVNTNPRLAQSYIDKALDRASEAADAWNAYKLKNPQKAVKFFTPNGELDVSAGVKANLDADSNRRILTDIISNMDLEKIKDDPNLAVLQAGQARAEFGGEPKAFQQAIEAIMENKFRTDKFYYGVGKDKTLDWKLKQKDLSTDIKINTSAISRIDTEISKLDKDLRENGLFYSDTEKAEIKAEIELKKTARREKAENNLGKMKDKLETYEKMGTVTKHHKETKKLLSSYFKLVKKFGAEDAWNRLNTSVKKSTGRSLTHWIPNPGSYGTQRP